MSGESNILDHISNKFTDSLKVHTSQGLRIQ
jgi:hypothetical protein